MEPPSNSTQSKRKRPRHVQDCVANLVTDVMSAHGLQVSKEAHGALAACHQAFLTRLARGLTQKMPPQETKKGKNHQVSSTKEVLERHLQSVGCGDLWEQALQVHKEQKSAETSQRKKKKKKAAVTQDLLAEQERLLEASKQKALQGGQGG